ncbi:MAG: Endopolyphosphatase [Vezdaea acicularis]|nr:MAG: Endopolyphosphatase [Vezdaea acicularis]
MRCLAVSLLAVTAVLSRADPLAPAHQTLIAATTQEVADDTKRVFAERKLHGKFLHITDLHPDPFYKVYASTAEDDACHRGSGPAGAYGAETSDCDSPLALINATFDWIDENLKDSIDFVIWTGDSARHDNDERIPRTVDQVLGENKLMVQKFKEVWGQGDGQHETAIPVIPTFGNNDILPHNIMTAGPNIFTTKYLHIWKSFIPEEQRHGFQRGGWFFVEVIPNQLAVFSLNTMYFFDNNAAVDGCNSKNEPGYEHMEWLRIQLQFIRERGMKAIMMGHVPPARTANKISWDETCWQKYALWMHQYRDVVIGSIYGHMNIDHFLLQDAKDIDVVTQGTNESSVNVTVRMSFDGEDVSVKSASEYLTDLRDEWSDLPEPPVPGLLDDHVGLDGESPTFGWLDGVFQGSKKKKKHDKEWKEKQFYKKIGGKWAERFSTSLISASVVPNYFPTLRVIEYNLTGLDASSTPPRIATPPSYNHELMQHVLGINRRNHLNAETKKEGEKLKKPNFIVPKPPSKTSPPGPGYSPQTLSWLGYTQYYANLTYINNDLAPGRFSTDDMITDQKWHDGKHRGKKPKEKHPKPQPRSFEFIEEYNTFNDTVWKLKDLTVRSYLKLAIRIGSYKPTKEDRITTLGDELSGLEAHNREFGWDGEDESAIDIEKHKNKKKKHKKKKKKKHRHAVNKVWFSFVKRAFVGTIDDDELHEEFGQVID